MYNFFFFEYVFLIMTITMNKRKKVKISFNPVNWFRISKFIMDDFMNKQLQKIKSHSQITKFVLSIILKSKL